MTSSDKNAEQPLETEPAENPDIKRLEEEAEKFRDQWMRAAAETENVRKRAQRDQEDTARYAITGFARDMVSVLENLKRADESLQGAPPAVTEGIHLTLQELLQIFERYGIKRIDPMGQKFDHNLHQAVAQVEQTGAAPGTVVQVVQAGYVIHDRLLRPAMVAVAKGEPAKPVDTTA